ncbi:MAG: hypothetical protein EA001_12475 [Oscillatoriales cyanobacterium]|nr:MAG: hypothetical protein EA001_12475 [Oscillatoriales cyanobacterium]
MAATPPPNPTAPWSQWLHRGLFPTQPRRRVWLFWLLASLAIAGAIGWAGYRQATGGPYIVQDDARQHVFWMQRLADPELFPGDWIADYFQSVAPEGYRSLYRALAVLGGDPLQISKWLPIPLGLLVAGLTFGLTTALLPIPIAGFWGAVLMVQSLGMNDDLASATPRSFLYPLFLAFAWGWVQSNPWLLLPAIGLLGLFYPQYVLVAGGILAIDLLWRWRGRWWPQMRSIFTQDFWHSPDPAGQRDRLSLIGGVVAAIVLGIYALQASDYGPVVTAAQARSLPEFFSSGRANFFDDNWFDFWILGQRSSLLPKDPFTPATLALGLLLPLVWWRRNRLGLGGQLSDHLALFPLWLLSGVSWYVIAHLLLFRLHLPGRYTQHSLRMILPITAALVLTIAIETLLRQLGRVDRATWQRASAGLLAGVISLVALLYPLSLKRFPKANYVAGESPGLYQFAAAQPKTWRVASIAKEADNLPTFAARSVLVAREYAIPYHWGYYRVFRQRAIDLLQALYSPDLAQVRRFNQQYAIDAWLIDRDSFSLDYLQAKERRANRWLRQFQPVQQQAIEQLQRGQQPALRAFLAPNHPCQIYQQPNLVVLSARCIMAAARP